MCSIERFARPAFKQRMLRAVTPLLAELGVDGVITNDPRLFERPAVGQVSSQVAAE